MKPINEPLVTSHSQVRYPTIAKDIDDRFFERSVTIRRPIAELFAFWRNLENLPRIMRHLESVTKTGPRHSHWVAKTIGDVSMEWDAETIDERENERIVWRSLEGSEIRNEGTVLFREVSPERGVEVKVRLQYAPPGGKLGVLFAKLFGKDAASEVEADLARFKQFMEAGEVASTEGQSSGRDERHN